MDLEPALNALVRLAEEANPRCEGDYEVDGLLHCGVCKTPKEMILPTYNFPENDRRKKEPQKRFRPAQTAARMIRVRRSAFGITPREKFSENPVKLLTKDKKFDILIKLGVYGAKEGEA